MSHLVATVVCNGVAPFEMAVPCEVFGFDRSDLGVPWYDFRLVAAEPPPITTAAGFTIDTPWALDALEEADTIIVAPTNTRTYPGNLIEALQRAHARGARIASICTGAFIVATAGLLDGRSATTHWLHTQEFAKSFPAVEVDPNVLYIDHGDVATAAGTASGIDLCLHLVRNDFGADIANALARRLVVPPHRDGGQAQYIEQPMIRCDEGDHLAETLAWVQKHLDEPITVDDMARRAAMSPRTFARRFPTLTGMTPHQWLIAERLRLAQRLLETTDLTVDWVAIDSGFGSAANMRQHFQNGLGVSPGRYRAAFRKARSA